MKKFMWLYMLIFLAATSNWAMEDDETDQQVTKMTISEEFNPDLYIVTRKDWGAQPATKGLEFHTQYLRYEVPTNFIFGHTVTKLGNSIQTLQAIQKTHMDEFKFSDIAYNCCLDEEGYCYECRDPKIVPSILKGHNAGSYAIGVIGCYGKDDKKEPHLEVTELTQEAAYRLGKQLGRIAHKLGFVELIRMVNVFGMSELESTKYPDSPGKNFMAYLDYIVKIANQQLDESEIK
jgi:hypothetical protein